MLRPHELQNQSGKDSKEWQIKQAFNIRLRVGKVFTSMGFKKESVVSNTNLSWHVLGLI